MSEENNKNLEGGDFEQKKEVNKKIPFKDYFIATWEVLKILALAALIVIPIRYFVFQPFIVRGESMSPNFESGDYLIIDELSYRFVDPKRGDVIVFRYPLNPRQHYIKRIIGLPGETVIINQGNVEVLSDSIRILIDESGYLPMSSATDGNMKVDLKDGEYFVMGDNRQFSYDSRRWGTLPKDSIVGRALIRLFPITNISLIQMPAY